MSIWDTVKRWLWRNSDTASSETEFIQSADGLFTACKTACEAADEFIVFLSGFLSELQHIRHTVEGARYLSELSSDTSVSAAMKEQIPTIEAAIQSVCTQIETRGLMLGKHIEALEHLKTAVETVQGQIDQQQLQQLQDEILPLKTRIERQRSSIQSLGGLIYAEREGFLK